MRSGINPERSRRVFFLIPIEKTKRCSPVLPVLEKICSVSDQFSGCMFDDQECPLPSKGLLLYTSGPYHFEILHGARS